MNPEVRVCLTHYIYSLLRQPIAFESFKLYLTDIRLYWSVATVLFKESLTHCKCLLYSYLHNVSISTSCCQEVPKQIRAEVMGLAENSSGNTGEKKNASTVTVKNCAKCERLWPYAAQYIAATTMHSHWQRSIMHPSTTDRHI